MRKKILLMVMIFVSISNLFYIESATTVDHGLIRVNLASMGNVLEVNIEINGSYSIAENSMIILERKQYIIRIEDNALILIDGQIKHNLGTDFRIVRHAGAEPNHIRIRNTAFGWINYHGDMRIRLINGRISLVNYIFVETYLYGVVPAEMPNNWPIEALKAQAVAARTFALRSRNANRASISDLCDTQNSQVYRGFNPATLNSIQAVDQTSGLVLMNGNLFVNTFYSSSNGGVIEASTNIWTGGGALPYSLVREDPFDLRNTLNPNSNWSLDIHKTAIPIAVQNGIAAEIAPLLAGLGFSRNRADVVVREIRDISANEPNTSGRTTSMRLTLLLDVVRQSDLARTTIEHTFVIERTVIRRALTLRSLLFAMQDMGDRYRFIGRGFGHGVGMSQFGAHQMALENHTFDSILSFYFAGTQLTSFNLIPPVPTEMPSRGNERPESPVEVTQQEPIPEDPTESQQVAEKPKEQNTEANEQAKPSAQKETAVVSASSLNIRSGAGTSQPRLAAVTRGTSVTVLERQGDWAKIEHNGIVGFVLAVHLRPSAAAEQVITAVVTANRANLRSGPGTSYSRLASLVRNTSVEVLTNKGTWTRVKTPTITGYIDSRLIRVANENASRQENTIRSGIVTASTLNVRKTPGTNGLILGRLNRRSSVSIISTNNGWHKIRNGNLEGYVLAAHVR